ncbi:MAG: hypothetical protein Q7R39_13190 [Dehalococcoidia bacterium]|nr:hypothetical protein [Dehalococcoidia bacterium]
MSSRSHILCLEHQPVEVLLDQTYFPGIAGRLQFLRIAVSVDVDEVELAILTGVALSLEPLVKHQVILLLAFGALTAGSLTPDDQRPAFRRA